MPDSSGLNIEEKQGQENALALFLMLSGSLLMAWYNYGPRALLLTAVCIFTAVVSDFAGLLFVKSRKRKVYDFSSALTGLLIALMLPANFPLAMAAMGTIFAIVVGKLPFGGTKGELLTPAAAGLAFLSVSQPVALFDYPKVLEHSGLFTADGNGLLPGGESLAAMLKIGDSMRLNSINILKLLTGAFPGPMGTGCIVVLLAGAVYLVFKKPAALLNSLGMLTSAALFAALFPRVLTGRLSSVIFELMAGALIFSAFFLITDETTSPTKGLHRFIYGAFTGFFTMLLRYFGVFQEGVWFAVLVSNAAWVVFSSPRPTFEEPQIQPVNPSELGGNKDV